MGGFGGNDHEAASLLREGANEVETGLGYIYVVILTRPELRLILHHGPAYELLAPPAAEKRQRRRRR